MLGRANFFITGRTASSTFFSTLALSLSAPLLDGISAPVHRMAIVNLRIFNRISCRVRSADRLERLNYFFELSYRNPTGAKAVVTAEVWMNKRILRFLADHVRVAGPV